MFYIFEKNLDVNFEQNLPKSMDLQEKIYIWLKMEALHKLATKIHKKD